MEAASSPSLKRRRPVPVQRPPPKATTPPGKKGATSRFFKLQPPVAGQKISKERRRPGLSKGPVKQKPKPQFSTKAIGQKPGQAEAEAAAAKEAKAKAVPDSAFIAWLRAGNGNRAETQNARNYLLEGPPFLGLHDYERKEAVRDAGAVWNKNPQKQEGCTDKSIRFGWYGAPNERVLEALLELEPREKEKRGWRRHVSLLPLPSARLRYGELGRRHGPAAAARTRAPRRVQGPLRARDGQGGTREARGAAAREGSCGGARCRRRRRDCAAQGRVRRQVVYGARQGGRVGAAARADGGHLGGGARAARARPADRRGSGRAQAQVY